MAIVEVSLNSAGLTGNTATSRSLSYTPAVTSGNRLVAIMTSIQTGALVHSVTDNNSGTWTKYSPVVDGLGSGGGGVVRGSSVWYRLATASDAALGAGNLTVTGSLTSGTSTIQFTIIELSGTSSSTLTDVAMATTATSATSAAIGPAAAAAQIADEYLICALCAGATTGSSLTFDNSLTVQNPTAAQVTQLAHATHLGVATASALTVNSTNVTWPNARAWAGLVLSIPGTAYSAGVPNLVKIVNGTLNIAEANISALDVEEQDETVRLTETVVNVLSVVAGKLVKVVPESVRLTETVVNKLLTISSSTAFQTPSEVLASMTTTIRQSSPDTPDLQSQIVRLDGTTGAQNQVLFDVERTVPLGVGAQVLRAELHFFRYGVWSAGTRAITLGLLNAEWDAATVTYNNAPSIGATVTGSVTGVGADADELFVDVTSIIAASVNADDATGSTWHGLKMTTSTTVPSLIYSAYSDPDLRPYMLLEWSIPPEPPEDLKPSGGRAVPLLKPPLYAQFYDLDAEDSIAALQVQVDTAGTFTTTTYDSGLVATTNAVFDMAAPPAGSAAVSNLVNNTSYWWRMACQDNHGLIGDYAEPVQFLVKTRGTLALTSPTASTASPTPAITAVYTPVAGEVLTEFEIEVAVQVGDLFDDYYVVSRYQVASNTVTQNMPVALEEGSTYLFTVRGWLATDYEDLPGARDFVTATQTVTLTTASTV